MKTIVLLSSFILSLLVCNGQVSKTITNLTPGSLFDQMTANELSNVTQLTLSGTIDARDFYTMRNRMDKLTVIDLTDVTIAEYVGIHGTSLFIGEPVQDITYPENTIPDGAFYEGFYFNENKNLTTVLLPASITSIGNGAFMQCDYLNAIPIPSKVTSINGYAFKYCSSLTSITIPASVTSIGEEAFSECTALTSITAYPKSPAVLAYARVFNGVSKTNCTLYVPAESVDLYKAADGWKDFLKIEPIPPKLVVENKMWSCAEIGSMPGSTYQSYFVKFMGDTTINGVLYKKILKSFDESHSKWVEDEFIREDPATQKVFMYVKNWHEEILLYDFSLEAGDSVLMHDEYFKVDKVVYAPYGNSSEIRKQFYFKNMGLIPFWVEGIGNVRYGILKQLGFFTGGDEFMVCYFENYQLIYHNPRFSNCFPKETDRLIVDAGNDTTYCAGLYTTEIPMGLKVNIQNGVEPYTYAWECLIVPYGILEPQTASDILKDSTVISPTFKSGVGGYADQIILKLHVTDHAGNTGTDSIRVRFSKFAYLTGYLVVELSKGDSTQFKFSSVGGGIEPLTFEWQPRTGLSNPDSLVTWAKPEVSTQYNIIATDSCGCVSEPNLAYEVRVKQASLEFAPIGAEWYYSDYESYNPPQANYIKHTSIKDSTINGKPVKIIQKTRYQRSGATSLGYEYLYQHGDTIFYWKNNEFHALYNFSLAKGDSMLLYSEMPAYIPNDPYGWVEIDTTYTTTINNYVLKTYSVSTKKGSYWDFGIHPIIEKIGSLTYLLPQNIGYVVDVPNIGLLRCYTDPVLGEFHFEDLPCDTLTTFPDGVNLYDRSLNVKIYPNPFSDVLIIEGDLNEKEYTLELYSIKGELIKTECFGGNINYHRVDVTILKNGSYFLRLMSPEGKYAEEMIIKR